MTIGGAKRNHLVPARNYVSREFYELENEHMWPKVWLIACRLEEVKNPGDFVVFDIVGESIIIVRVSDTEIKAFYNVCQHRGRRLKHGCGNTGKSIKCMFHGWKWKIDGSFEYALNREDWEGVPNMTDQDLRLKEVRFDTWGGWVWVSMDPNIEPLLDYLAPVPEIFENFEFENCRIAWHKTVVVPCNWKLTLDAFNEGYHVDATHHQIIKYGWPKTHSEAFGKHAYFCYPPAKIGAQGTTVLGAKPDAGAPAKVDFREMVYKREIERDQMLQALISKYAITAADRLKDVLPAEATYLEVIKKYRVLHREEAVKAGVKWPDKLTEQQVTRAGTNWHVFPNTVLLPCIDGALWYRSRPNGSADSMIFDIWWLTRYPDGKEPKVKQEYFASTEEFAGQNYFLEQDFSNLLSVQQGVHSRGFEGARTNPVQEVAVSNFHKVLAEYVGTRP